MEEEVTLLEKLIPIVLRIQLSLGITAGSMTIPLRLPTVGHDIITYTREDYDIWINVICEGNHTRIDWEKRAS